MNVDKVIASIMTSLEECFVGMGYRHTSDLNLSGGFPVSRYDKPWKDGGTRIVQFGAALSGKGNLFVRMSYGIKHRIMSEMWTAVLPKNSEYDHDDLFCWFVGRDRQGRVGFDGFGSSFIVEADCCESRELTALAKSLDEEFISAVNRCPIYFLALNETRSDGNAGYGVLVPLFLEVAGSKFGLQLLNDYLNQARGINPPLSDYQSWAYRAYGLEKSHDDEEFFAFIVDRVQALRKSGQFWSWKLLFDALSTGPENQ